MKYIVQTALIFIAGVYLFQIGHPVAGGWVVFIAALSMTIPNSK
jgi:hypothetical protein